MIKWIKTRVKGKEIVILNGYKVGLFHGHGTEKTH